VGVRLVGRGGQEGQTSSSSSSRRRRKGRRLRTAVVIDVAAAIAVVVIGARKSQGVPSSRAIAPRGNGCGAGLKARGRKVPAGCHRRQWARTLCKSGRCRAEAGTSPRRTGTDRDGEKWSPSRHRCHRRLYPVTPVEAGPTHCRMNV
jgi:hypothetical protein